MARRADLLVTTCEATADAVAEVTGMPRERVIVTSLGHRPPPTVAADPGVTGAYVLAVGAITPRKGFETLAIAANQVPGFPHVLIAGPDGWAADDVRDQVAAADAGGLLRFLGAVSEERLDALYQNALFVCHPSLAEGFGLACLEAMAFGRALVATDLPATREITGGAALLVDAGNAAALAGALAEVASQAELRGRLGELGQTRAAPYTWEHATDKLVSAYQRALD